MSYCQQESPVMPAQLLLDHPEPNSLIFTPRALRS